MLAILLPSVLALGAALRAAVEPATPQQSTPEAKEAAPAQGGAPGAKGLSAEAKESLALLRDVLQHDGRNACAAHVHSFLARIRAHTPPRPRGGAARAIRSDSIPKKPSQDAKELDGVVQRHSPESTNAPQVEGNGAPWSRRFFASIPS